MPRAAPRLQVADEAERQVVGDEVRTGDGAAIPRRHEQDGVDDEPASRDGGAHADSARSSVRRARPRSASVAGYSRIASRVARAPTTCAARRSFAPVCRQRRRASGRGARARGRCCRADLDERMPPDVGGVRPAPQPPGARVGAARRLLGRLPNRARNDRGRPARDKTVIVAGTDLLQRPGVLEPDRGRPACSQAPTITPAVAVIASDSCCSSIGCTAGEKFLEVVVVVGVLAGDRFLVGLEKRSTS